MVMNSVADTLAQARDENLLLLMQAVFGHNISSAENLYTNVSSKTKLNSLSFFLSKSLATF